MPLLLDWDRDGLDFATGTGARTRLGVLDLLDCAPARFDPASGQRLEPLQALPPEIEIISARATEIGWRVTFRELGAVDFRFEDLAPYLAPRRVRPARVAWLDPPAASLRMVEYDAFLADDETRRQALARLARFGWIHLRGAPARKGEIERLVASFAYVRETNYGRLFDVKVETGASNLANTDRSLEPHTDNPYRAPVPGLQVLHCIRAEASGGENRILDGLGLADALRAADPDAFEVLARVPVRFAWSDARTRLCSVAPVIRLDRDGGFVAIRYNHRSFRSIEAGPEERTAWRHAYRRLADLVDDPANGVELRLAAGDMLVMDNHRVLHGRLPFASDGERHLQGTYVEADGLHSTLSLLNEAAATRRVDEIEALFASAPMGQNYGEDITIREHMLQSAELASGNGLGDALVAAALLHDLGWGLDAGEHEHERTAADLLEPILGRSVSDPIRLHVAAKRYLVATDPGYHAHLSRASIDTLARQGGPFSPDEAKRFEADAAFADAVLVRRIDDDAKRTDYAAPPFGGYRSLLLRLALAHLEN